MDPITLATELAALGQAAFALGSAVYGPFTMLLHSFAHAVPGLDAVAIDRRARGIDTAAADAAVDGEIR
jgi:hypothetical protein